jgi:hypothetical protein
MSEDATFIRRYAGCTPIQAIQIRESSCELKQNPTDLPATLATNTAPGSSVTSFLSLTAEYFVSSAVRATWL